ncbi:TRAP transporter small permease [Peptoniphilus equinus]|uniref:TRAP transporter small permease n=1 Tax=Peptoniphilus equinus TaxID=3016343 RepID=A0ABY7QW37_9FIRM|nr:TRAP transporter small permease [Peptoniphilus equinus]WBW50423.1 TRAP transporter small permease [Peptoniphilus equinus]
MNKIKQVMDKLLEIICVVVFSSMVISTTYQVVVRYVFNSPSAYSETITKYLFVWLILYSAAYVFGKREHISIGVLKNKLKGKNQQVVEILIEFIIIIFAVVVMVYGGFNVASMNMLQYDSILGIPTGFAYSCIPISGILIIFYSVYNLSTLLKKN